MPDLARPRCLLCSIVLIAPVLGQTIYDDFSGPVLGPQLWGPWGTTSAISFANGRLVINLPAGQSQSDDVGFWSVDGFDQDFDFTLEFAGFSASNTGGIAEFALNVFDTLDPWTIDGDLRVSRRSGPTGGQFYATGRNRTGNLGTASTPTTATSGELRLTRTGSTICAHYRIGATWTTLTCWPNFMARDVTVEVSAQSGTGSSGGLTATSDWISYAGLRLAKPNDAYGSSCHTLRASSHGFPHRGSNRYWVVAHGDPQLFANQPLLFLLGATPASLNLAIVRAPACFLNVFPVPVLVPAARSMNPEGEGGMPLSIPSQPILIGQSVRSQFACPTTANALGFAFSNGIATTIIP